MNKKFFTWMAGGALLLTASVGTANAQTDPPTPWKGQTTKVNVMNITSTEKGEGLNPAKKGNLYQIAVTTVAGINNELNDLNTMSGVDPSSYTVSGVKWPFRATSQLQNDAKWSVLDTALLCSSHKNVGILYMDSLGNIRMGQKGGYPDGKYALVNAPYQNTLFCVNLTANSQDGSNPRIDITNRGVNLKLQISPDWYRTMGRLNANNGYLGGWGFSNYYTNDIAHWQPLYTYVPGSQDTVYLFANAEQDTRDWGSFSGTELSDGTSATNYQQGITTPSTWVEDGAIPTALDYTKAPGYVAGQNTAYATDSVTIIKWPVSLLKQNVLPNNAILIELINPAPVFLTADMYNNGIAGGKDKIGFDPEKEMGNNPWTDNALVAHDTTGFAVTLSDQSIDTIGGLVGSVPNAVISGTDPSKYLSEASRWLYFTNGSKYVFVDTVKNQTGNYYAGFNYSKSDPSVMTQKNGQKYNLGSQAIFQLRYWYGNDSLSIDVAQSLEIDGDYTGTTPWFDMQQQGNTSIRTNGWQPYWDFFYPGKTMSATDRAGAGALTAMPAYSPVIYMNGEKYAPTDLTALKYTDATAAPSNGDKLHVRMQDLTPANGDRILTIGQREIGTHIGLGLTGCTVAASNLTTIATDLYTITNSKGEYLFVPIYNYNGKNDVDAKMYPAVDQTAKWETLDTTVTKPYRMPNYQWAVVKVQSTDPTGTSRLMVYNREFPEITANVQLYKDHGVRDGLFGDTTLYANDKYFQPMSAAIKADSTLGYFWQTPEQIARLGQNTFAFNYYNALDNSRYLDVMPSMQEGVDSTLTLNGANGTKTSDKTLFQLYNVQLPYYAADASGNGHWYGGSGINYNNSFGNGDAAYGNSSSPEGRKAENYGYSNARFPGNQAIAGLAPLYREAFVLQVKDATRGVNNGRFVTIGNQTRYSVKNAADLGGTATDPQIYNGKYAIFFLKTNNSVRNADGTLVDYYAFMDISLHENTDKFQNQDTKLGIEDATLWGYVQTVAEQRTSTFAVEQSNEPLYRRFDGGTYGSKETPTKEQFGDSNNAPQWLKFTRQNNYGNEFLFENSPLGMGNGTSKDNMGNPINDYRQDIVDSTISFLGLYNINQYPESLPKFGYTFYVDTAYSMNPTGNNDWDPSLSRASQYTVMPQYMLAVRPDINPGGWVKEVTTHEEWDSEGQYNKTVSDTTEVLTPSYVRGFWVFNAQDSVGDYGTTNTPNAAAAKAWGGSGYSDYVGRDNYGGPLVTRLAFVDGVHVADTFYVVRGAQPGKKFTTEDLANIPACDKIYLGQNTHYTPRFGSSTQQPVTGKLASGFDWSKFNWGNTKAGKNDTKDIKGYVWDYANNGKSMVFEFRLYDPEGKLDNGDRRFFIESQGDGIGPDNGRWVKIQNGVPVMTDWTTMSSAKQNGLDVFNVMAGVASADSGAVANEAAPAVGAVKVISGEGNVTVLNASGKTVTVSNILGQTIAKQTLSSDAATITLPKGIVIVAVEGEAAVKAIVR